MVPATPFTSMKYGQVVAARLDAVGVRSTTRSVRSSIS